MEHVAAPKPSAHRSFQECLEWVWPTMSDGCHLTREMWKSIEEAGFTSIHLEHFRFNTLFTFLSFMMYGFAVKGNDADVKARM